MSGEFRNELGNEIDLRSRETDVEMQKIVASIFDCMLETIMIASDIACHVCSIMVSTRRPPRMSVARQRSFRRLGTAPFRQVGLAETECPCII